jgi:hypothetical protein
MATSLVSTGVQFPDSTTQTTAVNLASPAAIGSTTPNTGAFTTVSASGNVTLSGGTANGVTYLNGSKVVTSGSALTFDGTTLQNSATNAKLSALNVGGTGGGGLYLGSGASTDFILNFDSTPYVKYNSVNSWPHTWTFGATEAMRLTSTGLGIGTSSPSAKLHVSVGNENTALFQNSSSSPALIRFRDTGTTTDPYIGSYGNSMAFGIYGGAESMRIVNGNLGIGTSSPATKLEVAGDVTAKNYLLNVTAGTYGKAGDTSIEMGTSADAAPRMLFRVNGSTERMRIDSSGNLGIGTSSPLLTASGRGNITINGSSSSILVLANGGATSGYMYGDASSLGFSAGSGANSRVMTFDTNGTTRLTLDSSGNLGLGVTPSAWRTNSGERAIQIGGNYPATLHADGGGYFDIGSNYYLNSSGNFIYTASGSATRYYMAGGGATSAHVWQVSSSGTAGNAITFTQAMTLDASGNLGIGTTSLDLVGSTTSLTLDKTSGNGQLSLAANGTVRGRIFADNSSSELRIGNPTSNPVTFFTANTERMRIDSSGNVGIGTSSPAGNLQISGSGDRSLLVTGGTSGTVSVQLGDSGAAGQGGMSYDNSVDALFFKSNGSERFRINTSGAFGLSGANYGTSGYALTSQGSGAAPTWTNVSVSNAANSIMARGASGETYAAYYYYASDMNLKKDVTSLTDSTAVISALNGRKFAWKETEKEDIGFIAQEVEQIVPEAVNTSEAGVMSINQTPIVAHLVEAVKTLIAQNAELTQRIAELEKANGITR